MRYIVLILLSISLSGCFITEFITGAEDQTSGNVGECDSEQALNDSPFANSSRGASGISSDPFLICTETQLQNLINDNTFWTSSFSLGNDIDLQGTTITPIGDTTVNYSGTFNGEFFTISNFSITGATELGLFGVINASGTVRELFVSGATISGTVKVGILAGQNDGVVDRVGVRSSSITSSTSDAGGLIGTNNGTATDCFAKGINVQSSGGNVGGLVGDMPGSGLIQRCYAEGVVNSSSIPVGGILGNGSGSSTLQNSFASVIVSGTGVNTHFDAGSFGGASGNDFFDNTKSCSGGTCTTTAGSTGVVTSLLQDSTSSAHSAMGWDFLNLWTETSGGFPEFQTN